MKYALVFVGAAYLLVSPSSAAAKTAQDIRKIAQETTVEIKLQRDGSVGSGIIINQQDNLYTLVTNRHVVCARKRCKQLPSEEKYSLRLADGQKYAVDAKSIKLVSNDLDLAIIQFRSSHKYLVAQMADPGTLRTSETVYTSGFPFENPKFSFNEGRTIAVVNKRITGDSGGYSVIYDANTLPGMSGGGVFDTHGRLAAIHGLGDRYQSNSLQSIEVLEAADPFNYIGKKIGSNRGIPIRWLIENAKSIGIDIENKDPLSTEKSQNPQTPATADEFFIAGLNKNLDPGQYPQQAKEEAIQYFTKAIELNPRYVNAYYELGRIYHTQGKHSLAMDKLTQTINLDPKHFRAYIHRGMSRLATAATFTSIAEFNNLRNDFDQAIKINPNYSPAYFLRSMIGVVLSRKEEAFADIDTAIKISPEHWVYFVARALMKTELIPNERGAISDMDKVLADYPNNSIFHALHGYINKKFKKHQQSLLSYNKSIELEPGFGAAYSYRGLLKAQYFNDPKEGMKDLDQGILLDPKNSVSYLMRGITKYEFFNDIVGAIADCNRSISLNPEKHAGYYFRAQLLQRSGKKILAMADYRKVVSVAQYKYEGYVSQGIIYIEKNLIPEAINILSKAIQDNPVTADAYEYRGLAYQKQGNNLMARKDWEKAAKRYKEENQATSYQLILKRLQ